MLNRILGATDKVINFVMVAFFILLILIGGYAFLDSYIVYEDVALDDEIISLKPKVDENYNFDTLRGLNPDIEGWITIFETSIDYPVLHSKDNLDYLNFDYKRNYTIGGSIFVDYRNGHNFSDDYSIIYGHNMMTGQMFSDIKKYENNEYFNQHLYGVLYAVDDVYKLEVLYLAKINAFSDDIYSLITYANHQNPQLSELVKKKALVKNSNDGDVSKLLLLSTCDSFGSNDRTVLLARISSTNNEEVTKLADAAKANAAAGVGELNNNYKSFEQIKGWLVIIVLLIVAAMLAHKIYNENKKERK